MLFGLKSEKLKLSDIKVVDENTIRLDEPEETASVGGGKNEDKPSGKKKTGGQPGHAGSGRQLPEGLPIVERIITLPEGEIVHGIPAAEWVEQPGMEEKSYVIRKKVIWYIERVIRKTYKPPPDCDADAPAIITAKTPAKLIPRGKYGTRTHAFVVISDFTFASSIPTFLPRRKAILRPDPSGIHGNSELSSSSIFSMIFLRDGV